MIKRPPSDEEKIRLWKNWHELYGIFSYLKGRKMSFEEINCEISNYCLTKDEWELPGKIIVEMKDADNR